MSFWRQITRGIRTLMNPSSSDSDVSEEVQHFLDQSTTDFISRGYSLEEARRAAKIQMGSMTSARQQVRSYGWENIVDTFFADLRYALRQLRRNPGFTAITILTLALGIGATTAIFSAVNPILFESLPYPHAGKIMMIWEIARDGSNSAGTFGMYRNLEQRTRTFEAMAVFNAWQPTLNGLDQPEQLQGQHVTANYFRILGVSPLLGKDFEPADERVNATKVVILSNTLWQRRFGGDRAIVGRSISLNGSSYTVAGVMPPEFENLLAPTAEVWTPLQYDLSTPFPAWGHNVRTIGRLQAGANPDQAAAELHSLGQSVLLEKHPPIYGTEVRFAVTSLQNEVTRGVRPALFAVIGAVNLVLLIACVNVTNLLLARGAQRRGEFSMRAALGAARTRIIRQLLTESVLLAALGGAVGLAIAAIGVRALVALSPAALPRVHAIGLNSTALAFAFGISLLVGLFFGVVPAIDSSRSDLQVSLQQGSRRTAGGRRMTRSALVVAEVTLALVLLVVSGLLLRSMQRLFAVDPGFNSSQLLTMRVQTSGHHLDDKTTQRFFQQSLEAVRLVPGVTAAAFTSQLPLSGDSDIYGVQFESDHNTELAFAAFRYAVTPGYFEAMGIPLRRGRLLDERDVAGAPVAVVINESFAKRKFPGGDAVGQHVHVGPTNLPWFTIVGVVGDVKQVSLAANDENAVYITPVQSWFTDNAMSLVVRATHSEAAALAPSVRQAIWSVDREQPIAHVASMDDLLATLTAERRFALILFELFALAALILAAAGIYGVLSGSVAERTREIGVRAALGASRASILALVLRQGMTLTGLGVIAGMAGAAAASQFIATMLFGITRFDLVTYFSVIALLVIVSVLACAVPAWRAARVDPAITLRAE
jgi:putative ABC transport system permease protein